MRAFSAKPKSTKPEGEVWGCHGFVRTLEIKVELLGWAGRWWWLGRKASSVLPTQGGNGRCACSACCRCCVDRESTAASLRRFKWLPT